jgi:hypothetical protein
MEGHMKFKAFLILPLLSISLLALMPNYSDAHLARTSDLIIIGRVVWTGHSEFIQEHNVCTPWRVEVERTVAGESTDEITFYTRGGQHPYADEMLWVEDQALPREGEKALIFLELLDGKWFINGQILGYRQIDNGHIFGIQLDEYSKYISKLACGIEAPLPERLPITSHTTATIGGFAPVSGPAGDGTVTVVISGSGFGSSTGTVEYTYYQWPGYSPNFLDPSWTTIHSWSDTEIRTDVPSHASSGPIRVTPTSSPAVVSSSAFNVTFGYTKKKWPAATPTNVTLLHNDSSYPVPGCSPAIQSGLDTWSTAGAWFRYLWGGTTTDGDPEFNGGSNGRNSIHFGYFPGSSPPLGVCQIYFSYSHPNWHIYEMDIRFNLAETWSAGDPVTANDVESITLHEAGHGLQLMDVYGVLDVGKVMYGISTTGYALRHLSGADNDGIIYIYGSDGSTEIEEAEIVGSSMELNLSSNPTRGQTAFAIELGNPEHVRVEVFDILGKRLSIPFEGNLPAGTHSFSWQPEDSSPSGIYFLRASTASIAANRKFALIR